MSDGKTPWSPRVLLGALALFACVHLPAQTVSAPAGTAAPAGWGAIAAKQGWYGYTFNRASRADAEREAMAQCNRAAGRAQPCEVRAAFAQTCGALATGNYGEWGTATGATAGIAGQAAIAECGRHLPTEPCKVLVSVCSSPGPT
ncbi:MAG: DUF4189 domain-containing protein [Variovorax sp.]|nr:MAG: DUF4189 domain-containing protein [Variovorax sp.]